MEHCKEVKSIATSVDWHCELMTLFRDENLGCKFVVDPATNTLSYYIEHNS
jgi:hypothetical protein